MIPRIVFAFQRLQFPDGKPPVITLSVKEPSASYNSSPFETEGLIGRATGRGLDSPAELSAPSNMKAGMQLFEALSAGEEIRDTLKSRSTLASEGQRVPMYFDLSAADELNDVLWETLWTEDDKFLALANWPIGRMLQSRAGKVMPRTLQPPFRIAAILSSLGVDPRSEWQSLRKAVEASQAQVRVLLFLSHTGLYDELQELGLSWLEVELVPTEYDDLQTKITEFGPQVLHLFCHGSTMGSPHLEIATSNDIVADAGTSRYRLEARQIRELVRHSYETPWVIVLNACSTAESSEESGARSLSASLVRDLGIQSVVGMRKPVLEKDAACFTRNFYQSLLDEMKAQMSERGQMRAVDWASFTIEARQRLCDDRGDSLDDAASTSQEWTLPVVTVRPDLFRFETPVEPVTGETDKARFEAQFWEQIIANVSPDVQDQLRRSQGMTPGGTSPGQE